MKRKSFGFTLIEVMVVVGILGILIALSGPSVLSALRHRAADQLARALASSIAQARSTAILKRTKTQVVLYAGHFDIKTINNGAVVGRYPTNPTNYFDRSWMFTSSDLIFFSPNGLLINRNNSPNSYIVVTITDSTSQEAVTMTVYNSGAVEMGTGH